MTKSIPLVRISPFALFVDFLEEIGTPTETLLKQSKVPIFALENHNLFVSCYQAFDFVNRAANQEGIANLGILVAERNSLDSLGILGRLTCQSLTLFDAIKTVIYVSNFFNSCENFWLVERGKSVYLCQQYVNTKGLILDHICHFCLVMMINLIQKVAGKNWYPEKISLQTNFRNFTDHPLQEAQINCNVSINSIEFPRSFLSLPLPNVSYNYSLEEDYDHLFRTAPSAQFSDSLILAIAPFLKEGYPTLKIASEIVQISPRTLQRRLEKEGLTYKKLFDRLRYNSAVELLKNKEMKIIDIAYELGYQDPSHFTRAFKRWTGINPCMFQKLQT